MTTQLAQLGQSRPGQRLGQRRRHNNLRKRLGYNLLEVLTAMGVLAAGSVGLFAMQRAAVLGNADARQTTIGTSIAQRWIEVLRRDAYLWRATGAPTTTTYLSSVPGISTAPTWTVPTAGALDSTSFDYTGAPAAAGAGFFCVNTRYQWVFANDAIRADVRVWWPKNVQTTGNNTRFDCGITGAALQTLTDRRDIKSVALSVTLRWSPRP